MVKIKVNFPWLCFLNSVHFSWLLFPYFHRKDQSSIQSKYLVVTGIQSISLFWEKMAPEVLCHCMQYNARNTNQQPFFSLQRKRNVYKTKTNALEFCMNISRTSCASHTVTCMAKKYFRKNRIILNILSAKISDFAKLSPSQASAELR